MSNQTQPRPVGRPQEWGPDIVRKLEEVFALDGTISEACFYAGISRETYYRYVKADADKESTERKLYDRFEALRNKPILLARETIVKSLTDPVFAFKYMEKKKADEFGNKTTIKHEGSIENKHNEEETRAIVEQVTNEYEEKLKQALSTPTVTPQENSEVQLKHEEKHIFKGNKEGSKQGDVENQERGNQPGSVE